MLSKLKGIKVKHKYNKENEAVAVYLQYINSNNIMARFCYGEISEWNVYINPESRLYTFTRQRCMEYYHL
jgi:hypothetical protein